MLPELHPLQKKQRARQRGVHACVCVCVHRANVPAPGPAEPCRSQPGRGTWSQGLPKPFAAGSRLGDPRGSGDAAGRGGTGATGAARAQRAPCALRDTGVAGGNRTPPCNRGEPPASRRRVSALVFAVFLLCTGNNPGGAGKACPQISLRDQDFVGFISSEMSGERGEARTQPCGVVSVCGVAAAGSL